MWQCYLTKGGKLSHALSGSNAETNGSRLLRNDKVAKRVAELQAVAAQQTQKTVASLVQDLDDAIAFAQKCKNPSAVVAAIALQARLLGLEAPRQLEVMHRPAPLPTKVLELTEEEWTAQFYTGTGSRPTLTEGARRLKADRRRNGTRSPRPSCPEISIDADGDCQADQPAVGVIDLLTND